LGRAFAIARFRVDGDFRAFVARDLEYPRRQRRDAPLRQPGLGARLADPAGIAGAAALLVDHGRELQRVPDPRSDHVARVLGFGELPGLTRIPDRDAV